MKRAAMVTCILFVGAVVYRLGFSPSGVVVVSENAPAPTQPPEPRFLERLSRPALGVSEDPESSAFALGPEFLKIFSAFKYYLFPHGHDAMVEGFRQWALENYAPGEAAFLTEVFENYIHYLTELEDPASGLREMEPHERLAFMRSLREKIFGARIAGELFVEEDSKMELGIALLDIQQDNSLSAEEKKQKMQELMASLDPKMREALIPHDPQREYHAKLKDLDAANPNLSGGERAAKVRELRLELFGEEATARLERLDEVRIERAERMKMYDEELAALRAREDLSDEEIQAETERLQSEILQPEQIRRMSVDSALDSISPEDIAAQVELIQSGEMDAPDWESSTQRGENIPAANE